MSKYKYIYGPVPSWRLGRSLGVDLLSQKDKICNFSCNYCQLGPTPYYTIERKLYVPTEEIIRELNMLPDVKIDYITFSGRGESTLALNLGEVIREVKRLRREPVAILTNSALIDRQDVREDLAMADFVVAKLDATSQKQLEEINQPDSSIQFENIVAGLKTFRKMYNKRLALQIMLIAQNRDSVQELIKLMNEIDPDEVQLNTPLRRSNIAPLAKSDVLKVKAAMLKSCSSKIHIVSVYDEEERVKTMSISSDDTLRRRGKSC